MRDPRLIEFAKEMRREMTEPERQLWSQVRANRLSGIKFRRQKVIGPYIADFSSRDPMLVIEIDGDTHGTQEAYDATRTEFLKRQGYQVLRFTNRDVLWNLSGVLETILAAVETAPLPTLSPKGERAF